MQLEINNIIINRFAYGLCLPNYLSYFATRVYLTGNERDLLTRTRGSDSPRDG